jgi:hypothetical protein
VRRRSTRWLEEVFRLHQFVLDRWGSPTRAASRGVRIEDWNKTRVETRQRGRGPPGASFGYSGLKPALPGNDGPFGLREVLWRISQITLELKRSKESRRP